LRPSTNPQRVEVNSRRHEGISPKTYLLFSDKDRKLPALDR
jgi:hypothetical protein